jgi:hypothetical protein
MEDEDKMVIDEDEPVVVFIKLRSLDWQVTLVWGLAQLLLVYVLFLEH